MPQRNPVVDHESAYKQIRRAHMSVYDQQQQAADLWPRPLSREINNSGTGGLFGRPLFGLAIILPPPQTQAGAHA